MAKRHGLETVALLAAVSACSSGNRVDSPAAPPVSPAIFEDIREDIESLQSIKMFVKLQEPERSFVQDKMGIMAGLLLQYQRGKTLGNKWRS